MKHYLVNPLANNGIEIEIPSANKINILEINQQDFMNKLSKNDEVVIVGGDGTINHFINDVNCEQLKNNVYLLANGSGNDFLKDINGKKDEEILINQYLVNLPTVKVNGIEKKYVNNIGLGIDGYCCEVADKIREKSPNKKIDYTGIAIEGVLFYYKQKHVDIEVDGKQYSFDNVWLSPTMKGRYYGGGMMIAPNQDRNSDHLSFVVYHCKSKIKALKNFPKFFEGTHIQFEDIATVITGNKIHVKVSSPSPAQIDGETILNVSEYYAEL